MKRKRFSVEQIVAVLKQAQMGTPVADLIRHLGIAGQTFYRWKQRYGGLESEQVREFKQLQDENAKLKRLVADLSLDKVMLQDALSRKILRPSRKRIVVGYLRRTYPISERRACRIICCARATYYYRNHRDPRTALRQRLMEMAQTRIRYGYRKIRVLLKREGWAVGKKLVYRLYREDGLMLRRWSRRRRKSVGPRVHRPTVTRPNDAWTLDFVADQLVDGRRFHALTVIDVCTRECGAIEVGQSLCGEHVVAVLNRLKVHRGTPRRLFCDNGSEFRSQLMDLWAYYNKVSIDFSRPGTPTDNAHVESFNATLRRECLNAHWFESLREAHDRIEVWRREYNESRPHRALQDRTPEEFARAHAENQLCEPLITAGNSP